MSARLAMVRGAFVVVCALAAMALGAQRAQAEPQPETPPQSHVDNSPQPVSPTQAASTKSTNASTSAPASSSGVSTSTPSVRRVVTTPVVHNPVSVPSTSTTRTHTAPAKAQTATPKRDLAPVFELRDLAGLRDLPSVASSDGSGLLLAAGFALVLLVIAETSFLGLASYRFGVRGDRPQSRRRPADEPLPIRRIELRR